MVIKTFGKILKEKRGELSLRQLAKRIGVHASVILRYEKGQAFPSPEVVTKLCEVLDLSSQEIFRIIQHEKNPHTKTERYFDPNPFPELRSVLLEFYIEKFNRDCASKGKIKEIIETLPFHPIEMKILAEVTNIFKSIHAKKIDKITGDSKPGIKRINIGFTGSAALYDNIIDLLKNLSYKGKQFLLQKAKFNWSYDLKTKNIIFIVSLQNKPKIYKFPLWDAISK